MIRVLPALREKAEEEEGKQGEEACLSQEGPLREQLLESDERQPCVHARRRRLGNAPTPLGGEYETALCTSSACARGGCTVSAVQALT